MRGALQKKLSLKKSFLPFVCQKKIVQALPICEFLTERNVRAWATTFWKWTRDKVRETVES